VTRFRASTRGVSAKFKADDARLLADLATQLATLLSGRFDHAGDPALARLLPAAYRTNEEDAAEFRRFTEEELSDEKVRNALAIATSLRAEAVDGAVRVELEPQESLAWLKSLTDLRLVLAIRIGIDDSGRPPALDEESRMSFAIYNWLGGLQYTLVKAIDR
jgi:hypothetical protein